MHTYTGLLENNYCVPVRYYMSTTYPLAGHEYMQSGYDIMANGDNNLWSYKTNVAYYSADKKAVFMVDYYSRTTAKHISYWLRECFPAVSYSDLKKAMLKGYGINPVTGEWIEK